MKELLLLLTAYLIGSIPCGLLIARAVKGVDIRTQGSGNIGATNVFRVLGKKWGILAFILDVLKGALPVLLARVFSDRSMPLMIAAGLAAILGHTFPVWLRFRGGKGVATSLGVFLAIAWKPTLAAFAVWMAVMVLTRIVSASSLAAAVFFPIFCALLVPEAQGAFWLVVAATVLGIFIFFTHRQNIRRLLRGEEHRFGAKN